MRGSTAACLAVVVALHLAPGQERAVAEALDWVRSPDHLVMSFTRTHDMIAENDPVPLARVFGDGRVLVHIPAYMHGAGDYQMYLDDAEVRALIEEVRAAQQQPRAASTQTALTQTDAISYEDSEQSHVHVHLDLTGQDPGARVTLDAGAGTTLRSTALQPGAVSNTNAGDVLGSRFDQLMNSPKLQRLP